MAEFVETVRNLTSNGRWENLYQLCVRVAGDPNVMGNDYDYLLAHLNIEEHTLGILMVLSQKITEPGQDLETMYSEVEDFSQIVMLNTFS